MSSWSTGLTPKWAADATWGRRSVQGRCESPRRHGCTGTCSAERGVSHWFHGTEPEQLASTHGKLKFSMCSKKNVLCTQICSDIDSNDSTKWHYMDFNVSIPMTTALESLEVNCLLWQCDTQCIRYRQGSWLVSSLWSSPTNWGWPRFLPKLSWSTGSWPPSRIESGCSGKNLEYDRSSNGSTVWNTKQHVFSGKNKNATNSIRSPPNPLRIANYPTIGEVGSSNIFQHVQGATCPGSSRKAWKSPWPGEDSSHRVVLEVDQFINILHR